MSLFAKPQSKLVIRKLTAVSGVDVPAQDAPILVRKDSGDGMTPILVIKQEQLPFQRMPEATVTGIVAVSSVHGQRYFDKQGDSLDTEQLHVLAKALMRGEACFNPMHLNHPDGTPIDAGYCTEALVIDKRLAKAMNIPLPGGRECLIASFRVTDPTTLKMLESGVLTGFSIQGEGVRTPVTKSAGPAQSTINAVMGFEF